MSEWMNERTGLWAIYLIFLWSSPQSCKIKMVGPTLLFWGLIEQDHVHTGEFLSHRCKCSISSVTRGEQWRTWNRTVTEWTLCLVKGECGGGCRRDEEGSRETAVWFLVCDDKVWTSVEVSSQMPSLGAQFTPWHSLSGLWMWQLLSELPWWALGHFAIIFWLGLVRLLTRWGTVTHWDPLKQWVYFKDMLQMKQEGCGDPRYFSPSWHSPLHCPGVSASLSRLALLYLRGDFLNSLSPNPTG